MSYDIYLVAGDFANEFQGDPNPESEEALLRGAKSLVRQLDRSIGSRGPSGLVDLFEKHFPSEEDPTFGQVSSASAEQDGVCLVVEVSYNEACGPPDRVIASLCDLLLEIQSECDLIAWDPQLERAIDPATDSESLVSKYVKGREMLAEMMAEHARTESPSKRPWWRFW
ncbi:MAG: hypothetical protein AAFR38_09800 [Planctomycetota bacterium]